MAKRTAKGGLGIHQITYEQIPLHVYLFGFWFRNTEMGRDAEDMENFIWSLSDAEREEACCTNISNLHDDDITRSGFSLLERSTENGDQTLVLRKGK
jgi:hypothetical protein